jgi:hypothetical protein
MRTRYAMSALCAAREFLDCPIVALTDFISLFTKPMVYNISYTAIKNLMMHSTPAQRKLFCTLLNIFYARRGTKNLIQATTL